MNRVFRISFLIGLIINTIWFFYQDLITNQALLNLDPILWRVSVGVLIIITVDTMIKKFFYPVGFILVWILNSFFMLFDRIAFTHIWKESIFMAFVTYFIYLNFYKAVFDFHNLRYNWTIHLNSSIVLGLLLNSGTYGSIEDNILISILVAPSIILFLRQLLGKNKTTNENSIDF